MFVGVFGYCGLISRTATIPFLASRTWWQSRTAKDILAEFFRVRLSEVDEMIQNRFEAVDNEDIGSEENELLWPQEFSLDASGN